MVHDLSLAICCSLPGTANALERLVKSATYLRCLCGVAVLLSAHDAAAQNLLNGGDFELVGGGIAGWNLEEFATGSGAILDTASVVNFAPTQVSENCGSKGLRVETRLAPTISRMPLSRKP